MKWLVIRRVVVAETALFNIARSTFVGDQGIHLMYGKQESRKEKAIGNMSPIQIRTKPLWPLLASIRSSKYTYGPLGKL